MAFNKPYVSVAKKQPKIERGQSSIESFFGSQNGDRAKKADGKDAGRQPLALTTPEKVNMSRSNSVLSKALNGNTGFEELSSSDTSFDSPEVMNFKSQSLVQSFSQQRKGGQNKTQHVFIDLSREDSSVDVASQHDMSSPIASVKTQSSMKRTHDNLLDNIRGHAKKVSRYSKATTSYSQFSVESSDIDLSEEQKSVINYVVNDGLNVFYTGSAGTGKSVILKELVKRLQRKFGHNRVGIAASTGLAACNIGGQTLHKLLSIGLGTGSPLELAKKIKRNGAQVRKWMEFKVLIVDEISMIDANLFTKLDELAKLIRKTPKPFGGIQIICTGDFFQLPPVNKEGQAKFCFESPSWKKVINKTILLTQVFRQRGDNELIDMLNAVRYGELDDHTIEQFYKLSRKVEYTDGLEPTELFPTREEVKRANYARLNQLKSKPVKFVAKDNVSDPYLQKMLDNLMCEKEIELKEGAQVMYLKNYNDVIVNGSIGTIMFFFTDNLWGKVRDVYGILDSKDHAVIEELRFLSTRIGNTEWNVQDTLQFEKVPSERKTVFKELCNIASKETTATVLPVVAFKNSRDDESFLLVDVEEFSIDSGRIQRSGYSDSTPDKIIRTQVPLLLSWALSIHKAQGQTIDRLRIDLRKIFEKGQVYVALSRATSKNHLEIRNFDPRRITTSSRVKEFYRSLEQNVANNRI